MLGFELIIISYGRPVAPALYNRCPECLDGNLTEAEYSILKNISDNQDDENWRSGSDVDYRLEAITDWIFSLDSQQDISKVIKNYFDENGYKHFEEEEQDDEWDDEW